MELRSPGNCIPISRSRRICITALIKPTPRSRSGGSSPTVSWNGSVTGSEQLLKSITTTVEYQLSKGWAGAMVRLEYRYDESTGRDGGFFKRGELGPGT